MSFSSHKKVVGDLIESLTAGRKDADVVFVGSLRAAAESVFHPALSDIDVLIVPSGDSLDFYVSHFERAIKIARKLNSQDGWLADVFVMSHRLANAHYSCLSIYSGTTSIETEDYIVNNGLYDRAPFSNPDQRFKKKLYMANAARACLDYGRLLPVADTRDARKTAKKLLRLLKIIICAHSEYDSLDKIEERLFSVGTFDAIVPVFEEVVQRRIEIGPHLNASLNDAVVSDWSGLMIDQSNLGDFLQTINFDKLISPEDEKIYGDLGWVLRDLLIVGLKDVICATDVRRDELIKRYVDSAVSGVVRLALSGVDGLADLESDETPMKVRESYVSVTSYLEGSELTMYHVAAATILLEHAFSLGYQYCHDQL